MNFTADIKKGCRKRTVEKVKKDFQKYEKQTRKAKQVSLKTLFTPMDF